MALPTFRVVPVLFCLAITFHISFTGKFMRHVKYSRRIVSNKIMPNVMKTDYDLFPRPK